MLLSSSVEATECDYRETVKPGTEVLIDSSAKDEDRKYGLPARYPASSEHNAMSV